jgi:hypothetical protein
MATIKLSDTIHMLADLTVLYMCATNNFPSENTISRQNFFVLLAILVLLFYFMNVLNYSVTVVRRPKIQYQQVPVNQIVEQQ